MGLGCFGLLGCAWQVWFELPFLTYGGAGGWLAGPGGLGWTEIVASFGVAKF